MPSGYSYVLTMTALVFGPRLFGSFLLDFTVLPLLGLGAMAMISRTNPALPKEFLNISIVILLLASFTIITTLGNSSTDVIHIFKLLRSLVGGLAIGLLAWSLSRRSLSREVFLNIFIYCVVFHAIIVILQFFIPEIDALVRSISGYSGTAKRPTGLTWSLNAVAVPSAFAVFCLLCKRESHYLKIGLILAAMSLMGRTSFVLTVIFLIGYKSFYMSKASILLIAVFAILFGASFIYVLEDLSVFSQNAGTSYNQLTQYLQMAQVVTGQLKIEDTDYLYPLIELLREFLIFPESTAEWFFGAGISGRESVYIRSDMGWILNLFSFGIVGMTVIILIHLYILWCARNSDLFLPGALILGLILLLNFKENLLFARHVSAVLFVWLFYVKFPPSSLECRGAAEIVREE